MADETIASGYIRLIPSVDGIQSTLGQQFGNAGTSAGKRFSSSFLPSMTGLLAVAGGLLLAREVKSFVSEGVAALSKIDVLNAQTANVIKSTGGAANVSAAQIGKMAGALERTTATEAESIQEGANLLLTFKNIRNEAGAGNDIFDQTVTSMTDMARAMGTDASGGAIQLGKALNDPVAGIAALARVGVTFSDDQKKMIKSLVETGDLLGAQKIILAELNSQFGGSGAAYAETYAGKIALVGHEFGNLQEGILSGIMPALSAFAGLALDVLTRVNESPALGSFVAKINSGSDTIVKNVGALIDIIGRLSSSPDGFSFAALVNELSTVFPTLTPFLDLMTDIAPILPALGEALATIGPALIPVVPLIAELALQLLPALGDVIVGLIPLIPALLDLLGVMQQMSKDLMILEFIIWLAGELSKGLTIMAEHISGGMEMFQLLFGVLSGDTSIAGFLGKMQSIPGLFGLMSMVVAGFGTAVGDTFRGAVSNVRSFLNDMIRAVNGAIRGLNGMTGPLGAALGMNMNIGTIPLLAEGGTAHRSGWAVVGDAGPEYMYMPKGAQVRPLDNPPGGAAGAQIIQHVTMRDQDPRVAGRVMATELIRELAGS